MTYGTAAVREFQLRTGETLPTFPSGCTVDPAHNDTLASCCTTVGSTPTQATNGVFGCPYNTAFVPAANQSFGSCALDKGASSSCAPAGIDRESSGISFRWNSAVAFGLLAAIISSWHAL
ncbi:hypothetical protein R3P38DRAFT_3358834 [Favolaschia claudopus]|uniref:Uncharacterized protein n=1 Tax=Favolaschia claudopus TaxID=2862362 RepID=A0AAW0B242_9AGAR